MLWDHSGGSTWDDKGDCPPPSPPSWCSCSFIDLSNSMHHTLVWCIVSQNSSHLSGPILSGEGDTQSGYSVIPLPAPVFLCLISCTFGARPHPIPLHPLSCDQWTSKSCDTKSRPNIKNLAKTNLDIALWQESAIICQLRFYGAEQLRVYGLWKCRNFELSRYVTSTLTLDGSYCASFINFYL